MVRAAYTGLVVMQFDSNWRIGVHMPIDWNDKESLISAHFCVGEALYLPEWKTYHVPSATERAEIVAMAAKMELIRTFLGDKAINVNCWIRPVCANIPGSIFNGKNYNFIVRGAPGSMHIVGGAVDFTVSGVTCDEVRWLLQDKLADFNIRMEKKPNAGWIHADIKAVPAGGTRYFLP